MLGYNDLCKQPEFHTAKEASHELLRDAVAENKRWELFLSALRCIIQTLKALLPYSVVQSPAGAVLCENTEHFCTDLIWAEQRLSNATGFIATWGPSLRGLQSVYEK